MKTELKVNLKQYKQNIKNIQSKLNKNVKIMAIVKADGYGLGAVKLTQTGYEIGIRHFGVANISEALELRQYFKDIDILLLSEPLEHTIDTLIKNKITPTIYSIAFCQELNKKSREKNIKHPVHIKIDTGMRRVGINYNNAEQFINKIKLLEHLKIEGIYTHFANANLKENNFNSIQLNRFNKIINLFKDSKITYVHAANTYGIKHILDSQFNMVRIGLGGVDNIIELKSYLSYIKTVPKDTPIGYEGTFITKEKTNIGIVPLGYADGIPLELGNNGHVLIKGKKYQIIGKICMDMITINLGKDILKQGEIVTIIGINEKEEISIDDITMLTKTQPRYVLCQLNQRLKKTYVK